jgi:tetraacyldisaccharide 4'-kinase
MREPAYAAGRANVVILTRNSGSLETAPMVEASGFTGPVLKSFFTPVELIHLQKGISQPVSALKGAKVLAFCAIGNPSAFVKMLNELGATVLETVLYRDHFYYTPSDIQKIAEKAKALGAAFIVTTEKDAVKVTDLITKSIDIWSVRIQIDFFDSQKVVESLLLNC